MRPFHMTSRRRFDCRLTVLVTVWLLRAFTFRSYLAQLSWCAAFALPWMLCQRVVAGPFESVADLLAANCLECHDHHDAAGSLDLSRASGIQAGGESGAVTAPVVSTYSDQWVFAGALAGDVITATLTNTYFEEGASGNAIRRGTGSVVLPITLSRQ